MNTAKLIEGYEARLAAEKRAKWNAIQRDYPDLAVFLRDFNRAFGKPGRVRVTDEEGRVILETSKETSANAPESFCSGSRGAV